MTDRRVMLRCAALFLLLAVVAGGWWREDVLKPSCGPEDNPADPSALSQGRRNEYPAGKKLTVQVPLTSNDSWVIDAYLQRHDDQKEVMLKLRERSNFIHRLWKGFTNKLKVPRHPNAKKLTHDYKFEITLPDISCTLCTLQIQKWIRRRNGMPRKEVMWETCVSNIAIKKKAVKTKPNRSALAEKKIPS